MEIRVTPYHPYDFKLLAPFYENLHISYGLPEMGQVAEIFSRGVGFTVWIDNEIFGCGGIVKLWPGVGEGWILISPLVKKYPLLFHKTVLKYFKEILNNSNLVRVQCIVDTQLEYGHKWIKHLGFQEEGLMRKYFGGRDFIRYAFIKE